MGYFTKYNLNGPRKLLILQPGVEINTRFTERCIKLFSHFFFIPCVDPDVSTKGASGRFEVSRWDRRRGFTGKHELQTHVRFGSGDPRLQKERQTRPVEPPGGLHSDEDVRLLQAWLGDRCTLGRWVSFKLSSAAAAVPARVLRVLDREALHRSLRRLVERTEFGKAAGAKLKIHVEDDEEGEDQHGQPPADPSLPHDKQTKVV